jgi:hypothetical protein
MVPEYTVALARGSRGGPWSIAGPNRLRLIAYVRSGGPGPYACFLSRSRYAFRTFATFGAITIWQYGWFALFAK